ncbi:MAG: SDR family NAD(P)-dependent oxidoreductase [Actinomycetes bacterium]
MKNIAIIGATSGIAQACARIWAAEADVRLILIGRSQERLTQVSNDLKVRSPKAVIESYEVNFTDPRAVAACVTYVMGTYGLDIALFAAGVMPTQELLSTSPALAAETIALNSISPTLFAEPILQFFTNQNHGTMALIGSVAGDRGRKANYLYGASKAFIATYAAGLQHRFAKTPIRIVLIKPGPTATAMTAELEADGIRMAKPEKVAQDIILGISKGDAVIYTPRIWGLIMAIVRKVPAPIFNRLNF